MMLLLVGVCAGVCCAVCLCVSPVNLKPGLLNVSLSDVFNIT